MEKLRFCYLDYLDNYSDEALVTVTNRSNLSKKQIATILGLSESGVQAWYTSGTRKRIPTNLAWKNLLYELHVRQKGYDDLKDFLIKHA